VWGERPPAKKTTTKEHHFRKRTLTYGKKKKEKKRKLLGKRRNDVKLRGTGKVAGGQSDVGTLLSTRPGQN